MVAIVGGGWSDLLIGGLVALDSVVPVVPSEAAVIAASAAGGPSAGLGLVLVAALGAFVGDVAMHLLGRWGRDSPLARRLRRQRWMRAVERNTGSALGAGMLIGGRFLPGGRTAVSLLSGVARIPWRTYLPAAATGSLLWASYVTALGRLGSHLALSTPVSVALGVGIGLAVTATLATIGNRPSSRLAGVPSRSPAVPRKFTG